MEDIQFLNWVLNRLFDGGIFECSVGCTPESMIRLCWLEKIRFIQLEEFSKICVGSVIISFTP